MKLTRFALVSILAGQSLAISWAQAPGGDQMDANPPPPPPPAPSSSPMARPDRGGGEGDRMGKRRFLENVPPEIKQRFMEAREKAMQDPKIQELQRAFMEAMRAKMQEIDPSLAEYIKKEAFRPPMPDGDKGDKGDRKNPDGKDAGKNRKGEGGGGEGFAKLTDAEREQYLAARNKAKTDPAVEAAKAKLEAATTPDERHAAGEAYRNTIRETILKSDPSLKPVLDKMGSPSAPPPRPPGPPPAPAASASPAGATEMMN